MAKEAVKEATKTGSAAKVTGKGGAAKVAAEPKERKVREAKVDNRKIKLLVKENPKRAGSKSFTRYEFYKSAKTVQEYVDAGGSRADIPYDVEAGYIEVAE